MKIKLYNSITRRIEDFIPISNNEVSVYSCGPTVYHFAHIGNMRSFLFADLLQRVLRSVGKYNVKWVMNITNIDDKTIRDSKLGSDQWPDGIGKQSGEPFTDLLSLTNHYYDKFLEDIIKLGFDVAHFYKIPKATDYIQGMKELIKSILSKNFGYIANDSIYFNVAEYRKKFVYGKLFKIDFEQFQSGLRVDTDQYEREQVADFVLWKGKKDDEPYWDFEVDGKNIPGRPGWHIECSVMEQEILGLPFDIHTGGIDLKFPHHEDEIAQSLAGYGVEPTNYWCHNEFLEVEGVKMSKSAGNFYTLRDLEKQDISPIDVRYAMLSAHYRTKYNFTFNGITAAKKARLRMQDYINDIMNSLNISDMDSFFADNKVIKSEKILELQKSIYSELANDLHTPKALAVLFTFINNNNINLLGNDEKEDFLIMMSELNMIFCSWNFQKIRREKIDIPDEITELATQRINAKKAKNFKLADELRNKIVALGYNIIDTKDGYEIGTAAGCLSGKVLCDLAEE